VKLFETKMYQIKKYTAANPAGSLMQQPGLHRPQQSTTSSPAHQQQLQERPSLYGSNSNGLLSADAGVMNSSSSAADPKPRLRWTPELHERFVDAVTQLGGADSKTFLILPTHHHDLILSDQKLLQLNPPNAMHA
jgi:hypothetical protein